MSYADDRFREMANLREFDDFVERHSSASRGVRRIGILFLASGHFLLRLREWVDASEPTHDELFLFLAGQLAAVIVVSALFYDLRLERQLRRKLVDEFWRSVEESSDRELQRKLAVQEGPWEQVE